MTDGFCSTYAEAMYRCGIRPVVLMTKAPLLVLVKSAFAVLVERVLVKSRFADPPKGLVAGRCGDGSPVASDEFPKEFVQIGATTSARVARTRSCSLWIRATTLIREAFSKSRGFRRHDVVPGLFVVPVQRVRGVASRAPVAPVGRRARQAPPKFARDIGLDEWDAEDGRLLSRQWPCMS